MNKSDSALLELPECLEYISDRSKGLTRKKVGDEFRYFNAKGEEVSNEKDLARIGGLVIPPAWQDVWICPKRKGHLQATGRDEKGRLQSIYHPEWSVHRSELKFEHQLAFGKALPKIRTRVEKDLAKPGINKQKLLASVVRLLEASLIRIGNRKYEAENKSFGITTLKNKHAEVKGSQVVFKFLGKSKKSHEIAVDDPKIARIIRKLQALPGQRLFGFIDPDGTSLEITSSDVNSYLAEISKGSFTAKDFRTWAASVEAIRLIRETRPTSKKALATVVSEVAAKLGNTPSVCRTSYIHPKILQTDPQAPWVEMRCPRSKRGLDSNERIYLEQILSSPDSFEKVV